MSLPGALPSALRTPLCLLIPSGPGREELSRLADLIDACRAYADMPLRVVIINDGNDPAALAQLGAEGALPIDVLPNARAGRGDWWSGGLDMAMVDALRWIAVHRPGSAVLRLDSDALVIAPFASLIDDFFARDPAIGMAGNFDSPTGAPKSPGHTLTAVLHWRSKRISYDRGLHRLIFSFWGWRRRLRLLIARARRHGYRLGDSCQGGAYALSPGFLRKFAEDPFFAHPRDFLHFDICEDVLMALAVHALGFDIHYTTGPARLFASTWKGLHADPEALAAAGHAVIHSVKDYAGRTERDTRTFFRQRRAAALAAKFILHRESA